MLDKITNKIFGNKKARHIDFKDLTPIRKFEHEVRPDGGVNVLVLKFKGNIIGPFLQKFARSKYIRAELDEIGSAAWLLMDGTNKVDDMAKLLDEDFGEKIEPVYERLLLFLRSMHNNKFIYFQELQ